MYKYSYEKISYSFSGLGLFDGKIVEIDEDYHRIINEKAKKGWRYVGFFPTIQRGTGHIQEMELIFEKEIKDNE